MFGYDKPKQKVLFSFAYLTDVSSMKLLPPKILKAAFAAVHKMRLIHNTVFAQLIFERKAVKPVIAVVERNAASQGAQVDVLEVAYSGLNKRLLEITLPGSVLTITAMDNAVVLRWVVRSCVIGTPST